VPGVAPVARTIASFSNEMAQNLANSITWFHPKPKQSCRSPHYSRATSFVSMKYYYSDSGGNLLLIHNTLLH
jgi:hypothetical protein